jgi:hypothetical protein
MLLGDISFMDSVPVLRQGLLCVRKRRELILPQSNSKINIFVFETLWGTPEMATNIIHFGLHTSSIHYMGE